MPTDQATLVDTVWVWAFLALFALLGLGFVLGALFLRRLRFRHPETWKELGSPTLFLNASIRNQGAEMAFLWSSRSTGLDDPFLARLVIAMRILSIIYFLVFAGVVAGGILRQ